MKMFLRMFFCIVFFNAIFFHIAFTQNQNILTYLPVTCEYAGWDQEDSARVFAGEELFALIDGGADIYLEYGFRQVATIKYLNNHENSITIEIYEMSDASAAYGMFSLNTGTRGKKIQIGNEGMLFDYYMMFWKNTFLVFLTGADTTDETKSHILAMAASVDQRLGAPGIKPALTACLPNSDLQSCTYVRGNIGLSSFYTFDTKNIFAMKEGIIGSYPTHRLFIFAYASDKEAEAGYTNAHGIIKTSSRFSNLKDNPPRFTMTDQKASQLCVTHFNNLIVIVATKQGNDAIAICNDVILLLNNR
jgi:hypothetical protein